MPENILCASVQRREGRNATAMYQEVPRTADPTHDGCTGQEGPSWRWWMDETMPEHLCQHP